IIAFRLGLIRGKRSVGVSDVGNKFVQTLQEIALSSSSIESEVEFSSIPAGYSFSEEHMPFGPSAAIESMDIGSVPWNHDLEKTYYDVDLKASEAIMDLYRRGIPFSTIQKALSTGAMGLQRGRKLVPTRWSITACDTTIGDQLLSDVRQCSTIDCWRVHEFDSLNNHYAVLLMPTAWQYEWIEAFLHVMGREELIFSDHEGHRPKKEYSSVGGCYYSCKLAVLEALEREQKQAGAIVLREASQGYVPLGVFNVRENVRHAMLQPGIEFEDAGSALGYLSQKFSLPLSRFKEESHLLKTSTRQRQATLGEF
ncbi:MAG TPA: hypothetical protein VE134_06575, partial [Methanomicrobiales archaeon]|nr:hypothetical protein [Methanomicrobiales archaeon]